MWITIFALTFATAITFGVASVVFQDRPLSPHLKGDSRAVCPRLFSPPTLAERVGLVTCGGCHQTPQNGIVGDGAWVNVGDNILQRYRGCPVG